jgi:hypothetical protein
MPVSNILKRKIGEQLNNWIYLGIRTGARKSIEEYLTLKDIDPVRAESAIKRAIDMPHRARSRINQFIAAHTQAFLMECINLWGDATIAELNAELTMLENYAMGLHDRRINGGESWDSLAADIMSHVEKESDKWAFPFPEGYRDVWGE